MYHYVTAVTCSCSLLNILICLFTSVARLLPSSPKNLQISGGGKDDSRRQPLQQRGRQTWLPSLVPLLKPRLQVVCSLRILHFRVVYKSASEPSQGSPQHHSTQQEKGEKVRRGLPPTQVGCTPVGKTPHLPGVRCFLSMGNLKQSKLPGCDRLAFENHGNMRLQKLQY